MCRLCVDATNVNICYHAYLHSDSIFFLNCTNKFRKNIYLCFVIRVVSLKIYLFFTSSLKLPNYLTQLVPSRDPTNRCNLPSMEYFPKIVAPSYRRNVRDTESHFFLIAT